MELALAQLPSDHGRLAALVVGLPTLQRRVVEGFFLERRDTAELCVDLGLTRADLSAVLRIALRVLRDGFYPFA